MLRLLEQAEVDPSLSGFVYPGDTERARRGQAYIEIKNVASQRTYQAAGISMKRHDEKNQGAWWENF
jgi:hypothetical protein